MRILIPPARQLMRGLFLDSLGWQAGHEASVHALLFQHNQADPTAYAGGDDESDDESAKQHAWACVVDGLNRYLQIAFENKASPALMLRQGPA